MLKFFVYLNLCISIWQTLAINTILLSSFCNISKLVIPARCIPKIQMFCKKHNTPKYRFYSRVLQLFFYTGSFNDFFNIKYSKIL